MKIKKLMSTITAVAVFFSACGYCFASDYDTTEKVDAVLKTDQHTAYMSGTSDGYFCPEEKLTRAQAASVICSLAQITENEDNSESASAAAVVNFTDVSDSQWYAAAIKKMASIGAVNGYGEYFYPDNNITRAEFVLLLSRFYDLEGTGTLTSFSDVPQDYFAAQAISYAVENGWVNGYEDGTFHPAQAITRAEAATLVNGVLGRSPDKSYIDSVINGIRFFPDLRFDYWAYYQIMEAVTSHTHTMSGETEIWTGYTPDTYTYTPGFHYYNGELMYVGENGKYLRNSSYGEWNFNNNGYYTTGDAVLDNYLTNIVNKCTDSSMTKEQRLRALYLHVRDNYSYLKREVLAYRATGWENDRALAMLQTGKGNCYCYAALFYQLAKKIGYECWVVSGKVGHSQAPHGWVVIPENGVNYIYDTELEMAYIKKGNPVNLYKMTYQNAKFIYA